MVLYSHVKFSFPESQGDVLLVEIQDTKKAVQGHARIPISSLNDNPVSNNLSHYYLEKLLLLYLLHFHVYDQYTLLCRMREFDGGQYIKMSMNVLGRFSSP